MHITDALLGEHAVLYALFDRIDELLDDAGSARELAIAMDLVRPALVSHAKLEDELLFPELSRSGASNGPLPVMSSEHKQIDELLARVGTLEDLEVMRTTVASLLDFVREHFLKEEQVLLPMADKLLDDKAQRSIFEQWAKLRKIGG
jgi:regulator of cell morphogenesis and NO signaling